VTADASSIGTESRPRREAVRWLAVALALLIGIVNVGLSAVTGAAVYGLVGASYGFGVALYFSPYWRPILFLVAAFHSSVLGVLWLLAGTPYPTFGIVVGALSVPFVIAVVYLFATVGRE
jgi:hypothetical protein